MKCLVYCILRDAERPDDALPVGVDGKRVSLRREDGLAAAFSVIDDACDAPEGIGAPGSTSVSHATAYASVIEALHRKCTVLPLRIGCLLPSEERVTALLRERREEFLASLDEVQGCVEMVLHLAPGGSEQGSSRTGEQLNSERPTCSPARLLKTDPSRSPGIAHMVALTRRYEQLDAAMLTAEAVAEKCRAAFEGLFVKWKAEYSPRGNPPLDSTRGREPVERLVRASTLRLFFLVKRECQQSFLLTYQDLALRGTVRGLLSGPWPPHNFVPCERYGIASTLREQFPWK
jgi:hypothetical protein